MYRAVQDAFGRANGYRTLTPAPLPRLNPLARLPLGMAATFARTLPPDAGVDLDLLRVGGEPEANAPASCSVRKPWHPLGNLEREAGRRECLSPPFFHISHKIGSVEDSGRVVHPDE